MEVGEAVFPEGAADGPDVAGVADMAGALAVDTFDDFGIKANADDGHEMPVIGLSEVEYSDNALFEGAEGGFEGTVEAKFAGEEVFGTGGDDQEGQIDAGEGIGDGADGAIATDHDDGFGIIGGGILGELAGVFEGLGQVEADPVLAVTKVISQAPHTAEVRVRARFGIHDEAIQRCHNIYNLFIILMLC